VARLIDLVMVLPGGAGRGASHVSGRAPEPFGASFTWIVSEFVF
jgi:hypothetical protein